MPASRRSAEMKAFTRGVHHLALCTDDMKKTVDFYVEVLGMPLVHAMKVPPGLGTGPKNRGNPPYENIRHYFFDMGNDSLLAFFEIPKGKEPQANRNAIGGMQHCAFVVTPQRLAEIEQRLRSRGSTTSGRSRSFPAWSSILDPNGIRLELPASRDGRSRRSSRATPRPRKIWKRSCGRS
jgi:catechol 2,3-dioxygenase-like lactoylglutathione lyase family enzyme